jgi:hypothetical protein
MRVEHPIGAHPGVEIFIEGFDTYYRQRDATETAPEYDPIGLTSDLVCPSHAK